VIKNNFQESICRSFCMFFKEGAKEEMTCRGIEVLAALGSRGRIDLATMPPLRKQPELWQKYKGTLGASLCRHCAFYAEDCDFQSATPADDLEPCGAFILLAHLRAHHLLCESDLE
jgi:hypothetical protein